MDLEEEVIKLENVKYNLELITMAFEVQGNINNEIILGALSNIEVNLNNALENFKKIGGL